jgi:DUF2075 family protein
MVKAKYCRFWKRVLDGGSVEMKSVGIKGFQSYWIGVIWGKIVLYIVVIN